jgi:hypothetical protein
VDKNVDIEPNDGMKEPHKEETYGYAYAWWFGSEAHVARWQHGNAWGEQSESDLKMLTLYWVLPLGVKIATFLYSLIIWEISGSE